MKRNKTKIIGTIGPSSIETNILKSLRDKGLDSFRINLSHSDHKSLDFYYERFKSLGIAPSIDTQGAQIRVARLTKKVFSTQDKNLQIGYHHYESSLNDNSCDIYINHKEFFRQLDIGDEIKFGFDGLIVKITDFSLEKNQATADVVHPGIIDVNKALDISNKVINLEAFTEFDVSCIRDSFEHEIKEIYISFCSNKETILTLKSMLLEAGWSHENMPKLIAKIENRRGILNLEEIMHSADAILIDRGDLSRELRISMIPGIVKNIIESCSSSKVPCFVATNILDSMMTDDIPSRSEISDIYHLLSMGISGFVLAAEVAIGNHPIESLEVIQYMANIFYHEKNNTGIIPHPQEVIPSLKEPLNSWL